MKLTMKISHSIAAALVAGSALLAAGSASAQMVYAPHPAYDAPHSIPVDANVSLGWHGERYWDGRRYWEHDEWMRHHPHDHDPHRDHGDHGDHGDYRQ
ncbi:hypothetical protein FAZ95_37860 [Trinickia violacea]|uniref:DUF2502 domain-containing protein n=1 Tax=Trinickia violacea TaxID=2571746 RepID=A0A4P8J1F0_9BURK|nr:hypothetical protein [Trinickia violacea]QCP54636.1 hypothetical protein FAZ95_37860 [Trinickia violacea]